MKPKPKIELFGELREDNLHFYTEDLKDRNFKLFVICLPSHISIRKLSDLIKEIQKKIKKNTL